MKITRHLLRPAAAFAMLAAAAALAQQPPATRPDAQPSTAPKSVVTVDRIVAVVNDEVTPRTSSPSARASWRGSCSAEAGNCPRRTTLQRQVLERMINDLVQVQLAKETASGSTKTPSRRRSSASPTTTTCR